MRFNNPVGVDVQNLFACHSSWLVAAQPERYLLVILDAASRQLRAKKSSNCCLLQIYSNFSSCVILDFLKSSNDSDFIQ